jgi:hypothetical protein
MSGVTIDALLEPDNDEVRSVGRPGNNPWQGYSPYPQLTAKQKDQICRELLIYLTVMDRYRLAPHRPVARQGEQLALFSVGGLGDGTGD